MNEQVEQAKAISEEQAVRKRATGRSIGSALLLAIAMIMVMGIAVYLATTIQEKLKLNEANSRALQARIQALEKTTRALHQQGEALQSRVDNTHTQVGALLENFSVLYQQKNNEIGWQLTEIKYLLLTAAHRLVLARDVDTALVALQTADEKLKALPDPGLITVREQLLADMNRLKAASTIDFTGLALYLSDLTKRVRAFPLNVNEGADVTRAPARDEPPDHQDRWQRLKSALWQELKTLVVIRRAGEGGVATLLPQEAYFLYQNLRLQLESARLALLSRDGEQFQDAIKTSMDWLDQYFNTGDHHVSAALDTLAAMREIDFDEPLPTIHPSLAALDAYITAQTSAMIDEEAGR